IARRRVKTAAAGTAALALRRCQPFDIGLHAAGIERRLDLGERLTWRELDGLRLRRQIARERRGAGPPAARGPAGGVVALQEPPGIFPVVRQLARERIGRSLA